MTAPKELAPWARLPHGGFIAAQHPHQFEGELDGGARPRLVIRVMVVVPYHPCRAQLRRRQAGLKAGMAGDAGIPSKP